MWMSCVTQAYSEGKSYHRHLLWVYRGIWVSVRAWLSLWCTIESNLTPVCRPNPIWNRFSSAKNSDRPLFGSRLKFGHILHVHRGKHSQLRIIIRSTFAAANVWIFLLSNDSKHEIKLENQLKEVHNDSNRIEHLLYCQMMLQELLDHAVMQWIDTVTMQKYFEDL